MDWTREHLLVAMHLYCQIPFGRLHARNPTIAAVARRMGRSPGSLAMKLVNFAALDPVQQSRGIAGLRNVSRADRDIWNAFQTDWEASAETAAAALRSLPSPAVAETSGARIPERETDRIVETVARSGQEFFRQAVLSAYRNTCCVTGLAVPDLLVASHIIPWKQSSERRLDPRNGLCLSALYDRAFDRGLISFNEEHRLLVGKTLLTEARKHPSTERLFMPYAGARIRLPDRFTPDPEALRFHRELIYETA